MDAAVIALVASVATAAIGGVTTFGVAVVNRRRENENSADNARDEMHRRELAVKDERMAFKDEQIADCERDKAYWKTRALELEQQR